MSENSTSSQPAATLPPERPVFCLLAERLHQLQAGRAHCADCRPTAVWRQERARAQSIRLLRDGTQGIGRPGCVP